MSLCWLGVTWGPAAAGLVRVYGRSPGAGRYKKIVMSRFFWVSIRSGFGRSRTAWTGSAG